MKYGIQHDPPHPGVVLKAFIVDQDKAADESGIGRLALNEILKGCIPINTSTALKLADYLNTTPYVWLNLQMNYDLYQEMKKEQELNKAV
jgi:addiction module HigA family antidote